MGMIDQIVVQLQTLTPDDRWAAIQQNWASGAGHAISVQWVVIAFCVVIGVVAGWSLCERIKRRYPRVTPLMIFYECARELGLSLGDLWLLARIAHHGLLSTPLVLLMSPGTMRHYAERYLIEKRPFNDDGTRLRLEKISWRVFG